LSERSAFFLQKRYAILSLLIMKKFLVKNLKILLFLLSVVITGLMGALLGIILSYQRGFPYQIKNLEDIKPVVMTTIYDDKGELIKEFAVEKRTIIRSSDIPEVLKKALITSEDHQFETHFGINIKGLTRAILGRILGKNWGGGSSITQQLARGLFLTPEVTYSRKLKEILLAIQIERKYSKEQILTFYCNQIFQGGRLYGFEASSKYYFGKSVYDIALAEAALLVGIIPHPNGKYNIFKKPENCLKKRNYILKRMLDFGYVTEKDYQEAVKVALPAEPFQDNREDVGDYFHEEVRRYIDAKFGDTLLYKGGLKIYTTLNSEIQSWAEGSLKASLRDLDKRIGWRKKNKLYNLIQNKLDLNRHQLVSWKQHKIQEDVIVEGVVLRINSKRAEVRIADHIGRLKAADCKWIKNRLNRVLKKGDVALFKIKKLDAAKKELELGLEQEPEVQGAIIVVDNKTGEIKAMVGGYSYDKSQWNRATQAPRQPGSTFKPIIYTAALENGYNPASIIQDEPFVSFNQWTGELWEPQNHTNDFKGSITLRRGFEQSRNIVTARIVEQITPQAVVNYGRKFGITSTLKPYPSIALGTFEVKLVEMVAAYTVFPNLGIRVDPFLVELVRDQNGNIIEENYPDRKQVVEPHTAYIMNYLMQGVVKYGTGWRARGLKAPIGAKTGTMDDYTDAWFIGFSPSITVGVWVGYDTKRSMGNNETGSRAASPAFVGFMEKYLEKYPEVVQKYRKPSGVIMVKIDKYTGKLWTSDCLYPFEEAFRSGFEPTQFCTQEDHLNITDYFDSKELERIEENNQENEENTN